MKPTLWGLLTGFSLILFGGVIGRLIAEPQIYNDYRFAPVPAHTCLVYNYSTCGMYRDKFGDFIEVNRSGKLRKFNGSAENGPIYSRAYPVLTDAQVHVVQNQRAVLRKAAEFKASAIGAGWGIVVWLSAATGLWLLAQITRLHQRVRPKVSTIALRAGQSTQVYRQSFSEKLAEKAAMRALRADVENRSCLRVTLLQMLNLAAPTLMRPNTKSSYATHFAIRFYVKIIPTKKPPRIICAAAFSIFSRLEKLSQPVQDRRRRMRFLLLLFLVRRTRERSFRRWTVRIPYGLCPLPRLLGLWHP